MNHYDELGSPLVYLYAELETELVKNIARYINELDYEKTGFAFRQLKKLGLLNQENAKLIAKAAKKSLPEIKRIINEAGAGGVQETNRIYKEAKETGQLPLEPVPLDLSPELRNILDKSLANAKSMFNLTNTQAVTSCQRAFLDASNKAYLEVANGLKTKEESVKDAVLDLAKNGIRVGDYVRTNPETGEQETYYRNRMDTIIRRNIQTTIAQTEAASVIAKCKEFEVNTVAVSGHFGARVSDTDPIANHYGWQLKVYSIEGETDEYPNLEKCTGYPSNPLGLCGYNCRHRIYIFIPGASKLPRENYDETENRKYYELTQKQRAIERDIRTLKRQISAGNAIGADTTELTAKLGDKQAKMRQFVKDNGLTRSREREQENTGTNNRSVSAKATWAHRKSAQGKVANSAESGIINNRGLAMGMRQPASRILTSKEIDLIKLDAKDLEIDVSILRFNTGRRTGFVENDGTGNCWIGICGDILPDLESRIARDRMSQRAVLAHEYYGHYMHNPSEYPIGDWRDEFRASYEAAINTPNLSDEDRAYLMIDAYDRAKEAGETLRYDKVAREIIYGH